MNKPQGTSDEKIDSPINCLLYVWVSEEESGITAGVIQGLIPRTTSLIFPDLGFSEVQTKIDLIFPILVMAKLGVIGA